MRGLQKSGRTTETKIKFGKKLKLGRKFPKPFPVKNPCPEK
jgi:hypothetical protein